MKIEINLIHITKIKIRLSRKTIYEITQIDNEP